MLYLVEKEKAKEAGEFERPGTGDDLLVSCVSREGTAIIDSLPLGLNCNRLSNSKSVTNAMQERVSSMAFSSLPPPHPPLSPSLPTPL